MHRSGHVSLRFDLEQLKFAGAKNPRACLSAVAHVGRNLFLLGDENGTVERLTQTSARTFSNHRTYAIKDLLPKSYPASKSLDFEGLAATREWLWICGSHAMERPKVEERFPSAQEALKKLGQVDFFPERYLLACVPLVDGRDGDLEPRASVGARKAGCLPFTKSGNELTDALRADPQLRPFLELPGKENGLDIEGIAAHGRKVFLGLRGPVLEGWALVLAIEPRAKADGTLRLRRRGSAERRYTKHFLRVEGFGLREIRFDGNDLYMIAGPTMATNGALRLYRWRDAGSVEDDTILRAETLDFLGELPTHPRPDKEHDRAEGLALMESRNHDPRVLVVYDRPDITRLRGADTYTADLYSI